MTSAPLWRAYHHNHDEGGCAGKETGLVDQVRITSTESVIGAWIDGFDLRSPVDPAASTRFLSYHRLFSTARRKIHANNER